MRKYASIKDPYVSYLFHPVLFWLNFMLSETEIVLIVMLDIRKKYEIYMSNFMLFLKFGRLILFDGLFIEDRLNPKRDFIVKEPV